jgi:hypothetical protein
MVFCTEWNMILLRWLDSLDTLQDPCISNRPHFMVPTCLCNSMHMMCFNLWICAPLNCTWLPECCILNKLCKKADLWVYLEVAGPSSKTVSCVDWALLGQETWCQFFSIFCKYQVLCVVSDDLSRTWFVFLSQHVNSRPSQMAIDNESYFAQLVAEEVIVQDSSPNSSVPKHNLMIFLGQDRID